jgi:hypothetical protein
MPPQAVYKASLPMGIPMPLQPRSPNPKIRSPSVRTTAYNKSMKVRFETKKLKHGKIKKY